MDGNIFKMITIADIASMGNALSGLGSIFAIFIVTWFVFPFVF